MKDSLVFDQDFRKINGQLCKEVFCRYIVKKGKVIYPSKSSVFHFWIPVGKRRA